MGKKLLYLAIVGCLLCGGITASAEEKNILEIPFIYLLRFIFQIIVRITVFIAVLIVWTKLKEQN